MNFPRFWAQGKSGNFTAWRWSDVSLEEARTLASQAAARLAERFRTHGRNFDRYGYTDRPLREPILQEIRGAAGGLDAVITRNSYGCQVLNTAGAMFVDVDVSGSDRPPPSGLGGILGSLFGRAPAAGPEDTIERALARAEDWTRAQPDWNWRVYRTKAGLRLLATHDRFNPEDSSTMAAFDAVRADPLYRVLCKAQKSFRARLTPKAWRCGFGAPQVRWPFADAAAESRFTEWERAYVTACRGWATCQYVRGIGSGRISDAVRPLVELHDRISLAESGLPLA